MTCNTQTVIISNNVPNNDYRTWKFNDSCWNIFAHSTLIPHDVDHQPIGLYYIALKRIPNMDRNVCLIIK